MIKKWYNTIIMTTSLMLDIDDEFVLNNSNGEVTNCGGLTDIDELSGSLVDPDIFGQLAPISHPDAVKESMKMGHITLSAPVVNVQYFKGRKPVLASALKMSMADLDDIIRCAKYVVTDNGDTPLSCKQVLNENEYRDAAEKYGSSFTASTGADAIHILLEHDDVPDRQYMILNYLPVLPISVRYQPGVTDENEVVYLPTTLNHLYARIISVNNRLKSLKELGANDIVLKNQKCILQGMTDQLISNGARGVIYYEDSYYMPADSLDDVYRYITDLSFTDYPKWSVHLDKDAIFDAYAKYADSVDAWGNEMLQTTDPKVQKSEALSDALDNLFKPFVKGYINEVHQRYSDFSDIIFHGVICNMHGCIDRWLNPVEYGDDDEYCGHIPVYKNGLEANADTMKAMCQRLEKGIAACIDLYIKKQLKWNI